MFLRRIAIFIASFSSVFLPLNVTADEPQDEVDMQEVVITATALHESSLDVAQPTSVLQDEELVRDRGTSLGETLARIPGVSATWFGPQASRPVIRGQTGERVLVLEDGAEALDVAALSSDHAVTIDPLLAERVEVVRGPATLLYGNGAAGGLVNVVVQRVPEKDFAGGFESAVEVRGSQALGERAGAARIDGGNQGWSFHGDAYARETDDVEIAGNALSRAALESGAFSEEDIAARQGVLPDSASRLLGGAVGISRVGNAGFGGIALSRFETRYGVPGVESGVSIDLEQTRLDANADWRTPNHWISEAHVRASLNRYQHDELEPSGEVGTQFEQDGAALRVAFEHVEVAGWRGVFGAHLRDIDFVAIGEEAFVPASRTRNLGVYFYEERAFENFSLELGARIESQRISTDETLPDYDDTQASFASGLVWNLTDAWSTAVNLTSTQRHPSATELYADGPHLAVQRFEIGDAELSTERATTLDLSLRRALAHWSLELTAYRSEYRDYIYGDLTGEIEDDLPVARYAQDDARVAGFEAKITLPRIDLPRGRLGASFIADAVRARLDDGGDLPQIPARRVGLDLRYEFADWSAGISTQHHAAQRRIAAYETPTDSFTLVNLDFTWNKPAAHHDWLIYLRADNLLDEEARRHTSPLKDLAPLPGRSIGVGVRLSLKGRMAR